MRKVRPSCRGAQKSGFRVAGPCAPFSFFINRTLCGSQDTCMIRKIARSQGRLQSPGEIN